MHLLINEHINEPSYADPSQS